MAQPTIINGEIHFQEGVFFAVAPTFPASVFGNAEVETGAGIAASKLEHQHVLNYAQPNTAATSVTIPLHCAYAAGTIISVKAGSIVAATGNATLTVDLKKNGTTVLTAVITLDNANTARVAEAGTITTTAYVAGDLLELVITAAIGTGALPTGLFVTSVVREAAA